jgi:hypothetical protein
MLSSHPKQAPMTATRAEEIAARGLAFLADDMARLTRFLSVTGLSPQTLRNHAADRGVLAAVLQHLADDESLLLVFAAGTGLSPTEITPALAILAGPHRDDT